MNKFKKIIVNNIASSDLVPANLRLRIYKLCGLKVMGSAIFPRSYFEGNNVEIGRGSWINRECYFDSEFAKIKLGENCGIGMQVLFCTSSHEIGEPDKRAGESIRLSITIGNGCWIGAKSVILPGVEIGEGSIIAAGSVVTRDCAPNGLYAGVPAKRIKELTTSN